MIKTHIESYSTTKINNSKRLSQYLTKIFGEYIPVRIEGKQIRCYEVVKIDHTRGTTDNFDVHDVDSMPF